MKKLLLETNLSKIYIIVMILISLFLLGGYFSYAMFTVSKEKKNAISIVTGNLVYKLEVDGKESNVLEVPANTIKTFIIKISNPNNRKARFNFYYIGKLYAETNIGYIKEEGKNIPPREEGINLEKSGSSGSINIYKIRIINRINKKQTINLGVNVGLDYNDLLLPNDGYLFEETPQLFIENIMSKVNAEDNISYNIKKCGDTNSFEKEMYVFDHEAGIQQSGWTKEELKDYRYIGNCPNNYVNFNNEIWRIIGVFTTEDENGNKSQRVKIIRDTNIGTYSYDNKPEGVGSSVSNLGSNYWVDARIMMLLNGGYESDLYNGSLYYNMGKGLCYIGINNQTENCDFTKIGLNDESKKMIDKVKWYLGGNPTDVNLTAQDYYNFERGLSDKEANWVGEVALMYPSDYIYTYANGVDNICFTDGYKCSKVNGAIPTNGWMYSGITELTFSLSPSTNLSFDNDVVFTFSPDGHIFSYDSVRNQYGIRPTVYLKNDIKILSGDGSSTNPYVITKL